MPTLVYTWHRIVQIWKYTPLRAMTKLRFNEFVSFYFEYDTNFKGYRQVKPLGIE